MAAPRGTDAYRFATKEVEKTEIVLTIKVMPSIAALQEAAHQHYGFDFDTAARTLAFSAWTVEGKACTIYLLDPSVFYMPDQYGHELMHCVFGRWHDQGQPVCNPWYARLLRRKYAGAKSPH